MNKSRIKYVNFILFTVIVTLCFVSLPYAFGKKDNPNRKNELKSRGKVAYSDESNVIRIYQDADCNQYFVSIDWGTIYPGDEINSTAYIRNLGNTNITLLMETSNWNPIDASKYIELSWNYIDQPINTIELISVTWTLNISPDIENIQDFSFDVIITSYS